MASPDLNALSDVDLFGMLPDRRIPGLGAPADVLGPDGHERRLAASIGNAIQRSVHSHYSHRLRRVGTTVEPDKGSSTGAGEPPRVALPQAVCVVGAGYVGLTAAACLARLGHHVWCVEADKQRLTLLQSGGVPIHEPGLHELVSRGVKRESLRFTDSVEEGLAAARIAMLCVGTPPRQDGSPDLRQLSAAARQVAGAARSDLTVAVKSTVPPGTCEALELICAEASASNVHVAVVSNPEFLREGRAVQDFFHPDRIIVGSKEPQLAKLVADLYPAEVPVVFCDRRGAELAKYAANGLLSIKISFANEIAGLCERLGTDVGPVLEGVGLDARIGPAFLGPGLGFGGSCFPKDLSGLTEVGARVQYEMPLANAARVVNDRALRTIVEKLKVIAGDLTDTPVGVLGLAFKPGTDDVRSSPAVNLVRALASCGARVRAYDPLARPNTLPAEQVADPYAAAAGAEILIVATAWPEFAELEPARLLAVMHGSALVDAANLLPISRWQAAGFSVYGVGCGIATEFHPVVWHPIEWTLDLASA